MQDTEHQSLNQMNITFVPVEDRLLFRMTTMANDGLTEYRFWFTRRYVKLLWDVLYKMLVEELAKDVRFASDGIQSIIQFQQETALSKTDFKTPYSAAESVQTPLGSSPILLSKIKVSRSSEGNQTLALLPENGTGITITANTQMIHSLRKLIADTVKSAQWDLNFNLAAEGMVSGNRKKSIQFH